jgi:amino acid transporter
VRLAAAAAEVGMSLFWAAVIVLACTAIAVAVFLLVRRRAPEGGVFEDGDRAAGVFGVIATGLFLLVGFIIFLAFESYDASRSGSETEALMVVQQVETAQLLSDEHAMRLTGELVCYGRSVVHQEWPAMEAGEIDDTVSPWGVALFRTLEGVSPDGPAEEAAYSKWLDQTSTREEARLDRLHGAEGIIPPPLWIVLFLAAGVVFVFMLFFADSGERAYVQALQIGCVAAVTASLLVALRFLDHPYHGSVGGLQPVAMERSLDLVDQAVRAIGAEVTPPCSDTGVPES